MKGCEKPFYESDKQPKENRCGYIRFGWNRFVKICHKRQRKYYRMIEVSIHQEYITIKNISASNIGASKYSKQILTDLLREISNNTIIVKDFSTPVSTMNQSS